MFGFSKNTIKIDLNEVTNLLKRRNYKFETYENKILVRGVYISNGKKLEQLFIKFLGNDKACLIDARGLLVSRIPTEFNVCELFKMLKEVII